MNTRFLTTSKAWFGGGGDLNPPIPYEEDTAEFHAAYQAACDAHDPEYYPRFKRWADEYFFIPAAGAWRAGWAGSSTTTSNAPTRPSEANFAFTRAVGEAVPRLVPEDRAPPDGHGMERCRQAPAA